MRRLLGMVLTALLPASGLLLAPTPPAWADSKAGKPVGVLYGNSPWDPIDLPHNGEALNTLDDKSPNVLLVKHVADYKPKTKKPLCWETLGFFSQSIGVPPNKDLHKIGIDRGFTRFASHPYDGTTIVYVHPKKPANELKPQNAVFKSFFKKGEKTPLNLQQTLLLSKNDKKALMAGTLVIDHWNMVDVSDKKGAKHKEFRFVPNDTKTGVHEIQLMSSIPKC